MNEANLCQILLLMLPPFNFCKSWTSKAFSTWGNGMHSCSAGQKCLALLPFINNSNIYLFSPSEHYLGVTDITALCDMGAKASLSSNPSTHLLVFGSVISPWLPGSDGWRAACWKPLAVGPCSEIPSSQPGWKPWWEGSWVQDNFILDWENYLVSIYVYQSWRSWPTSDHLYICTFTAIDSSSYKQYTHPAPKPVQVLLLLTPTSDHQFPLLIARVAVHGKGQLALSHSTSAMHSSREVIAMQ